MQAIVTIKIDIDPEHPYIGVDEANREADLETIVKEYLYDDDYLTVDNINAEWKD